MKSGRKLIPRDLKEAIRRADFDPRGLSVTARGRITGTKTHSLEMPDTGQRFYLKFPGRGGSEIETAAEGDSLETFLLQQTETGKTFFEVSGEVNDAAADSLQITVSAIEPLNQTQ